jgi:hypothetical protein
LISKRFYGVNLQTLFSIIPFYSRKKIFVRQKDLAHTKSE